MWIKLYDTIRIDKEASNKASSVNINMLLNSSELDSLYLYYSKILDDCHVKKVLVIYILLLKQ